MSGAPHPARVGVVGARGHVGGELLALLDAHPHCELAFLGSRELAGKPLRDLLPSARSDLGFEAPDAAAVAARELDVCVLALPDGLATGYVAALRAQSPAPVVLDLSGDHRFAAGWHYGLPELTRSRAAGADLIANPGCYATGMQLAIAPLLADLAGPPVCFGVSGYSGAGTVPSPRNDPALLADNLLPYKLTGHLHEREVSHHLDREVWFAPHVASFFRGISLTITLPLTRARSPEELLALYRERYAAEPLVRVSADTPQVRDARGRHHVSIGGFALDQRGLRLTLVATLDNLLKGAATQALQNINLALGRPELEGIAVD